MVSILRLEASDKVESMDYEAIAKDVDGWFLMTTNGDRRLTEERADLVMRTARNLRALASCFASCRRNGVSRWDFSRPVSEADVLAYEASLRWGVTTDAHDDGGPYDPTDAMREAMWLERNRHADMEQV